MGCSATCWNAGIIIADIESPIRATVLVELASPITHSGCPLWKGVRRQPLNHSAFFSLEVSASDGVRFDGTALSPTDALSAVCTCANSCLISVS